MVNFPYLYAKKYLAALSVLGYVLVLKLNETFNFLSLQYLV